MKDLNQHISKVKSSLSELEELLTTHESFSLSTYNILKAKLKSASLSLNELGNGLESELLTFFDTEINHLEQNISSLKKEKENLMNNNSQVTSEIEVPIQEEEVIIAEATYTEEENPDTTDTIEDDSTKERSDELLHTEASEKTKTIHEKLSESSQNNDLNSALEQKTFFKNLSFDVNDRVYFQKELFDGDPYQFHVSLKKLQACDSYDRLEDLVKNELSTQYNWSTKEEIVSKLLNTVKGKTH